MSTTSQRRTQFIVTTILLVLITARPVHAQKDEALFDSIWKRAILFSDPANPVIQEFKLRGRYHGQYHWTESDDAQHHGWDDRRSRFGFDAKLFGGQLELRLDAQSTDGFDPFYGGLVDAYFKWKPSSDFSLTVGRQKVQIGAFDFVQASHYYPTFERSQIFGQLKVDRTAGIVAEGKRGTLSWQSGVYSNDIDDELGQFTSGAAFGAGVGQDWAESIGYKKALWRLDYLFSDVRDDSSTLNRYAHILSATLWLAKGRYGFVAEAFGGTGSDEDVAGFYVLPTYDLIPEKLQLAGRYTLSFGDGSKSLSPQKRYEAVVFGSDSKGDQYQAGYLGLQYFIYGDKLKLMAGAEYARLSGGADGSSRSSWTALTGVRFFF